MLKSFSQIVKKLQPLNRSCLKLEVWYMPDRSLQTE